VCTREEKKATEAAKKKGLSFSLSLKRKEKKKKKKKRNTQKERERDVCLHPRASSTFSSCVFLKFSSLFSSKKKLERRQKQE